MRGLQRESGSAVAWLALALAILAVVVAIVAYYRSGGPPLEQEIAREVAKATTVLRSQIEEIERSSAEARRALERRSLGAEAREALLAARAAIEEQGDVQQIRRDLATARADLQAMFEGETGDAPARWQALRTELDRADAAVGEDVDRAFAAVSAALERLARELERQGAETGADPVPPAGEAEVTDVTEEVAARERDRS